MTVIGGVSTRCALLAQFQIRPLAVGFIIGLVLCLAASWLVVGAAEAVFVQGRQVVFVRQLASFYLCAVEDCASEKSRVEEMLPIWSQRQRLVFLEKVLYWRGWVNRRDLMQRFGISVPQSSNDMVAYLAMNPGACVYHTRRKRYETTPHYKPMLFEPDFDNDCRELHLDAEAAGPLVVFPEMPVRQPNAEIFRRLTRAAFAREALLVHYFSISSGKEEDRWISPHAFASDGMRWHCRAYCHKNRDFRDFVIGRIAAVIDSRDDELNLLADEDWHKRVTLEIRPHEQLAFAAKKALELDYGMTDGVLRWRTRKALEIYVRRRLGFPDSGTGVSNEQQQLVLAKIS